MDCYAYIYIWRFFYFQRANKTTDLDVLQTQLNLTAKLRTKNVKWTKRKAWRTIKH